MSSAISQLLGFQTTASGYVYNREFITQPTPISHSAGKFIFFAQTHISSGVKNQKYFSDYNFDYLHSRCLQSFVSKLFVSIS